MSTATSPTDVDTVFRAFADPTRLRILNLLKQRDEICVCDLMSVLDLPQAKVSRHLATLRKAGLVDTRREGPWIHYRLTAADTPFHTKMLECLGCCGAEVPELQDDCTALAKTTCTPSVAGCC